MVCYDRFDVRLVLIHLHLRILFQAERWRFLGHFGAKFQSIKHMNLAL